MVIMRFDFKSLNDKIVNSASSLSLSQPKKRGSHFWDAVALDLRGFRERECFSLEMRTIRPSAVFGARRRNVLRGTGYAWTPGSGVSSNSLR